MKEILNGQRKNMHRCLILILCSFGLIILGRLGILETLGLGIIILIAVTAFILLFWGVIGFFIFRRRLVITHIIGAELLTHWKYETRQWLSWLPFNRAYEKLDSWNGKGYILTLSLTTPLFALGFLGGAPSGAVAVVLMASVSMLIPILNSLIYRKKQKNPEVYLSRYGAYVGGCLLKFFNRRDGSFITEATVVEDTFSYITLRLKQTGTGGGRDALFSGTHISERRILIPTGLTEDAKVLCESLSSPFTYKEAMSLKD